jgi:hypothetical protein
MPTLGQIALRIQKQHPACDPELVEGWIEDRYRQILDAVPWPRQDRKTVVHLPAQFAAGQIDVNGGSADVFLRDTAEAWTAEMGGRALLVGTDRVLYEFRWVSATEGLLDRNYEGTIGKYGYRLAVRYVRLPVEARLVRSVRHSEGGYIDEFSRADFTRARGEGTETGTPRMWCWSYESETPSLEVYPLPERATSLEVDFTADTSIDATRKTLALDSWLNPSLIVEGVKADVLRAEKDLAGARESELRFDALLQQAIGKSAERRAPLPLRPRDGDARTAHRVRRWLR